VVAATNARLRGVRRLLSERLWPDYDYERAEKINGATPAARRVTTGVQNASQGRQRGSAVHEQLHAIAAHGFEAARRLYEAKSIAILEPVARLLASFLERKWRVVCAELPVYDERDPLRVGSSIDLIAEQKADGRLILIELKVGGSNYLHKGNLFMQNELRDARIPNSPANQAMLQLLAYKALFERCYRTHVNVAADVAGYYVVYVDDHAVAYHALLPEVAALQPRVVVALSRPAAPATPAAAKRKRGNNKR
jgi:hypothetical protein